ncbi:MAG: Spy/CpxP family protein refolding chaperone [Muribaculaceae bacterium]|nr:Spy/CpxP family protein refolding chaperone [Muribaculaceae bacterium]
MKGFQLFLFAMLIGLPMTAQNRGEKPEAGKENFEKWFKEVREFKHGFMVRELGIKEEQKADFFRILDKMEDECGEVNRNARDLERQVREKGDKATDADYEKASKVFFEQKQKEAEIELRAYKEFQKVLTPEQLFKLKNADWKFSRGLMEKHRRLKGGNNGDAGKREHEPRRDRRQDSPCDEF